MGKALVNEPKLASEHIYQDLSARYPEGIFELFLHARGYVHEWHETGSLASVMPRLIKFCSEFPGAVVQYNPTHRYGIVSVITCDCSKSESNPCAEKCKDPKEHPRAFLRLVKNSSGDILVG